MFEGVAEIRINSQPCKGINLTTRHTWATETTQMAIIHNTVKESGQVLPCPNAVFHAYASMDTPWVAQTLSHCAPVKWGKLLSNLSTHEATKFGNFICLVCFNTFKYLFIRIQPMQALIDTYGGYHIQILDQITHPPSHSVFSHFS
jgi:hypothetical protein